MNYNSAGFIAEFCTSLQAIDYANWRLIVIDSGSSDGSMATIEASFAQCAGFASVRCAENIGFAAGANVPFDRGLVDSCEYVLFLNPDTVVDVLQPQPFATGLLSQFLCLLPEFVQVPTNRRQRDAKFVGWSQRCRDLFPEAVKHD